MPRPSILLVLIAALLILFGSLFWHRTAEAPAPNATSTPITTGSPVVVPTPTPTPTPTPVTATTTTPPAKPFTQIVGGPIVSLSATGLSLTAKREAPWVATFSSTTKFQKYTNDGKDLVPMNKDELYVGMHIRVMGTLLYDGTIAARTVTFGNPTPSPNSQTLKF